MNYVILELAQTNYAIDAEVVQQMEMVEKITPVPNAPDYVDGVVFSRGQVIPVINLRVRFGLPKVPYDLRTRLIVVKNSDRTVGLLVDTAREFLTIRDHLIQPLPEGISQLSGQYLSGIATLDKRVVLILQVDELLKIIEPVNDR
ncbi:MAG: chemotaxis protein CheW [Chroococcales cyanobacterium]